MIVNCLDKHVPKYTLVVSETDEFDLTMGRVYVVLADEGSNVIQINNDLGQVLPYTTEYFRFYKGETVDSY